MNIMTCIPRIRYSPQAPSRRDAFESAYPPVEALFKLTGWCLVIGTLHYGYIKTGSMSFSIPENGLTAALAYLVYTYFTRYTIVFKSGRTVVFDDGRPNPFRWHSFIAMGLVMLGTRLLILRWVDAVASLQVK